MGAEHVLLGILWAALVLYAVLGGADFGAGVWEGLTWMRGSKKERGLLYAAIAPVWEANHVWLIFAIVVLFTAFPTAFEAVSRALWVPFLLAMGGIVCRGMGFTYRYYGPGAAGAQRTWSSLFAFASIATPLFFGAAAGAVASGTLAVGPDGSFAGTASDWISPLSVYTAVLAVGACAYLAAVYLARETATEGSAELAETWRARGIGAGLVMGGAATLGLAVVALNAPALWQGFEERAWPLAALSAAAGLVSLAALWQRHHGISVVSAAAAVATIVAGWGLAQYPHLVPPSIDVETARAPDGVLHAAAWVIVAGLVVLVPSFVLLLRLFKASR